MVASKSTISLGRFSGMVHASKFFALTIPEYIANRSGEDSEDVDEETWGRGVERLAAPPENPYHCW
jgi:hypothetical protein